MNEIKSKNENKERNGYFWSTVFMSLNTQENN